MIATSKAGRISGSVTRRNIRIGGTPSTLAA